MRARFVRGVLDKQERFISYATKFYIVPIPKTSGSIEDFMRILLDEDGVPTHPCEYEEQRYRLRWFDRADDTGVYVLEEHRCA